MKYKYALDEYNDIIKIYIAREHQFYIEGEIISMVAIQYGKLISYDRLFETRKDALAERKKIVDYVKNNRIKNLKRDVDKLKTIIKVIDKSFHTIENKKTSDNKRLYYIDNNLLVSRAELLGIEKHENGSEQILYIMNDYNEFASIFASESKDEVEKRIAHIKELLYIDETEFRVISDNIQEKRKSDIISFKDSIIVQSIEEGSDIRVNEDVTFCREKIIDKIHFLEREINNN